MKRVITGVLIAIMSLFFPFTVTYADWNDQACNLPNADPNMCNPNTTAPDLAVTLINVIIGVLGVAAVAFIILSSYRYVTAQGNPEEIAKARQGIIFSVAGLIVALLAFAIVNFVASNIFG